jgi:hypothetical protein
VVTPALVSKSVPGDGQQEAKRSKMEMFSETFASPELSGCDESKKIINIFIPMMRPSLSRQPPSFTSAPAMQQNLRQKRAPGFHLAESIFKHMI